MSRIKKIIIIAKVNIIKLFENVYFFWFKHFAKKPHIMSFQETVDYIISEKVCVARYGDGEMKLMLKTGYVGFQELNEALADDLFKSFKAKNKKLLVCFHDIPFSFPKKSNEYRFYKQYLFKTYRLCLKIIDKNYIYGNTNFTRFYHPSLSEITDFDALEKYINNLKKIWQNRKILIVEGEETKLGLGNDLFDNCISVRRIICPKTNAYDKIDNIYNAILANIQNDELVLAALGPAASILCTRIALETSIQAIDIGHIDIVYLWFINKCSSISRVSGKYVNEANKSSNIIEIEYDETKYKSEIICSVL